MGEKINCKRKVYCEQCEYYQEYDFYNYDINKCSIPYYEDTFLSEKTILRYKGDCKDLNSNNDCQEFLQFKKYHFWDKWFKKEIRNHLYRIKMHKPFTQPKLIKAMKQILKEDME